VFRSWSVDTVRNKVHFQPALLKASDVTLTAGIGLSRTFRNLEDSLRSKHHGLDLEENYPWPRLVALASSHLSVLCAISFTCNSAS